MKVKILSAEELRIIASEFRTNGKHLVFTNGCFDILHVGHVRYLEAARELGDALLVAINSDVSVRQLKGEDRPINTESDRAEVIAALECVNFVTVFEETRVDKLLRTIQPAIYAKGGDYTVETLDPNERSALLDLHTKIEILPLIPGKSTTSTLTKIQQGSTK